MAAGKVHFTCQFGYFGLFIKNFLPVRFDILLERDYLVLAAPNIGRKSFTVAGASDLLAQIFKRFSDSRSLCNRESWFSHWCICIRALANCPENLWHRAPCSTD
jgi:hypothetical protein